MEYSIKSLEFLGWFYNEITYYFILLERDYTKYKDLFDKLFTKFSENKIILIPEVLDWQASSCYQLVNYVNHNDPLFIYNIDTFSKVDENDFREKLSMNPAWLIPCFLSSSPKYSYVNINNEWYISSVVEKTVISDHATNGMYFFQKSSLFFEAYEAAKLNTELVNNEYYVWPLYNHIIANWWKVLDVKLIFNHILWTPEELKDFCTKRMNK
jgi:NDP-sugar pyrophosphorylase family protein